MAKMAKIESKMHQNSVETVFRTRFGVIGFYIGATLLSMIILYPLMPILAPIIGSGLAMGAVFCTTFLLCGFGGGLLGYLYGEKIAKFVKPETYDKAFKTMLLSHAFLVIFLQGAIFIPFALLAFGAFIQPMLGLVLGAFIFPEIIMSAGLGDISLLEARMCHSEIVTYYEDSVKKYFRIYPHIKDANGEPLKIPLNSNSDGESIEIPLNPISDGTKLVLLSRGEQVDTNKKAPVLKAQV